MGEAQGRPPDVTNRRLNGLRFILRETGGIAIYQVIRRQEGRLIDLDLAKELDSMPSGARHRTGTMQFMTVEVLEGKGHKYRHDLESFFYVFVWMCIRYGYEGTGRQKSSKVVRLKTNVLRGWYTGIYTEIARNKVGDMGKNRFENIIVEFALKFEKLKPLARELRSTLFPIRDGDIFTGTFHDHNIMYDGMIIAFNHGNRPSREGGTGSCISEARTGELGL